MIDRTTMEVDIRVWGDGPSMETGISYLIKISSLILENFAKPFFCSISALSKF